MMKGRVDKHKCIAVTYKLMHIKFGCIGVLAQYQHDQISKVRLINSDIRQEYPWFTDNHKLVFFFYKICLIIQISHGYSLIRTKLYH